MGENGVFVLVQGVKVARHENIGSCLRTPSGRRGDAPDDHNISGTKVPRARQDRACKSARGRSRPAARMRVRRARSGGGAGLEARSRLRGYPRVDQAVGGAIRCSSGPAATISLCAGGGLKGTLEKRI